MRNVFFDWDITDYTGWGQVGYNLLTYGHIQRKCRIVPIARPLCKLLSPLDPVTSTIFGIYEGMEIPKAKRGDVLVLPGGPHVQKKIHKQHGIVFVNRAVFEMNPMNAETLDFYREFDATIVISEWNRKILEDAGIHAELIHEGLDVDLFHPVPKKFFRDRFVVFSGGQLHLRKGQDLALKAFSIFAKRHSDALLMAAWRSPWEKGIAWTVNEGNICEPISHDKLNEDAGEEIARWIAINGVPEKQRIVLDFMTHDFLPSVLRECDVGLFPNRCEGGTNLLLNECMAMGMTCIVSANTGHLDVITDSNCLPLKEQTQIDLGPSGDRQYVGWMGSSVDEIVDALERAYDGNHPTLSPRQSVEHKTWEWSVNRTVDYLDKLGASQ